jgi:replicative DNA helicase
MQKVIEPKPSVNAGAKLPSHVAENVLALLCLSPHGKLISGLVSPHDFTEEAFRTIATYALDYWKKYKEPPGKVHIGDLIAPILSGKNQPRADHFRAIYHGILWADFEGITVAYVLDQVTKLQRLSALSRATLQAAELIEAHQEHAIEDVEKVFAEVVRSSGTLDEPLYRLGSSLETFLAELDQEPDREFATGIAELDRCGIVPMRKTLMTLQAATSAGKGWWLIHLARQNVLLARKNVWYVTLELSRHQVTKRIYQSLACGAINEEHLTVTVSDLVVENDRLIGFNDHTFTAEFHMKDRQRRSRALREFVIEEDRVGLLDRLLIDEFPMRSVTVDELRAHLEQRLARGFKPDLICLDYITVLDTGSGDNHRIEVGRTVENVRGLATEYNIAIATAAQTNRHGQDAKVVRTTDVAEDISIAHTSDVMLNLTRSDKEQERGLARLAVGKGRHAVDNFSVVLAQNLAHGRFVRQSIRQPANYLDLLDNLPNRR